MSVLLVCCIWEKELNSQEKSKVDIAKLVIFAYT